MAKHISYTQKTNVTNPRPSSNRIILKLPPELILKVFSNLIVVTQSPFGLTCKAINALAKNFDPFKFTKISLWAGHYVELEYIMLYQVLRGWMGRTWCSMAILASLLLPGGIWRLGSRLG
jgi:hypothetical protein